MRDPIRQRGEGRAGCIFWVAVLVVGAMIGFKVVPVKYASAQYFDFMDEQAKFAQQTTPDRMKKAILRRARELELPVDPKKLTVQKSGGRIRIKCSYTVPLEFPGYTYYWNFEESIDEAIFIW